MPPATDSQKISNNWKRACAIYPVYLELSKRFELGFSPCGDLESKSSQSDNAGLVRAEQWFRDADQRIEVHHLRELLSQTTLDEEVLHAILARHLGKEPKNESDRDKIDFLLVQYLAQCLPAKVSAHQLSLEQAAEVLRPILGGASQPKEIAGLEECIRNLNQCQSLGDFMDHMILERGRALKVAGREKPFDPTALVAFTRFSFLVRLGSIRLVREDVLSLEEDLKSLESAGIKSIDCSSAERSRHESLASVRKMGEKWKQFFPGKYSKNYWFTDVIRVQACVKQGLEELANKKVQSESAGAAANGAPAPTQGGKTLSDQVAGYIEKIAAGLKSAREGQVATAIKVNDVRLMLSAEEVGAFRQPSAEMSSLIHAV
ncbi:MAG TPA: hypothetical protein VK129_04715, partial [Terriglobales bacterium]|nr:hypothetical protein [Terriglobales bacterium]